MTNTYQITRRVAPGHYEMSAGKETLAIRHRGRGPVWTIERNGRRIEADPFPTKREACSFAWDWLGEYA
jgi:hypothetical protein